MNVIVISTRVSPFARVRSANWNAMPFEAGMARHVTACPRCGSLMYPEEHMLSDASTNEGLYATSANASSEQSTITLGQLRAVRRTCHSKPWPRYAHARFPSWTRIV